VVPTESSSGRSPVRLALAFLAVYLIWGSTYLAIRYAIETLPGLLMAGARFVVAGGFVFAWGLRRNGERPSARNWREAFLLGGFFFLGGNGAVVWAERRVPSGLASLLIATMPFWVVLLDWARPHGSRPPAIVVLGMALGFAGLLLLVPLGARGGDALINPLGALVLVLGALSWATGSLYALHAELPESLLLSSGMEMIAGGILLLLAGTLTGEVGELRPSVVSARSFLAFAYLVVFGSIVAFNAFTYLLEVSTPSRVSTYAYVNPVIAVVLGWLLAGEALTTRTLLGATVIVSAVAMVTAGKAPARFGEEAAAPVAELAEEPPPT
jgi:drug/metabolite transporter (DMT)-like permease